jgi:peptide/nickel transport system substrate-binding protein
MGDRIGRRSFIAGGMAAVAGAAIGGAGGLILPGAAAAATGPRTNGPGRNGISTGKPKRGGSLTYGTDSEEQGFDPTTAEWDENGYMYGLTVFDPLTAVTTSGQVVPYLAQSVTPNSEYTSWTITMRPNIEFHDGTPCDGAALYTNLQKQSTSILTGAVFSQFIAGISQTGPLSVRVDMKDPWVTFPYYTSAASQVGFVAAPSMLNNPDGNLHPVGTGPFIFDSWNPNDHFTATRNAKYWRNGYPFLDRITYKPIADSDARSEALQAGNIDMMNTDTPQIIVLYRGKQQWSYVDDSGAIVGEPNVSCIQLNCGAPPFNNKNARLAVAKSYSQEQEARIIGLGITEPVNSPFVKGTPYYSETSYPGYDLAGAKAAVKAYERTAGKPLSFTLGYIPDPTVQRTALYLQQHYQEAGMKVALTVIDQNALISDAVAGKYEAVTWRQFGTVNPDLNYVFWSADTVSDTGISLNIARNNDPRIQAALTTGRQSTDAAARVKAYQSIGEYLAQDLPYTWLSRAVWAIVANPKVENFNNPVAPNGSKLIGMSSGSTWPTQVWVS